MKNLFVISTMCMNGRLLLCIIDMCVKDEKKEEKKV
jgi:hypothetical protein